MTNQMANTMKAVIKQKVHSALCNEESVDAFNKAMYIGKRAEYDPETDEMIMVDDPTQA